MSRFLTKMVRIGSVATLVAVGLSGCAGGDKPDGDTTRSPQSGAAAKTNMGAGADGNQSQGDATFSVGEREFAVELTHCSVYPEGDMLLSGPARESGTDITGYFDGDVFMLDSAPYGEFRVDIGADGPLQSTDDFLALGNITGEELTISETGSGYSITGGTWNSTGDSLGEGNLAFNCF